MKDKFQMYTDLRNTVKLALVAKPTQKNIIQKEGIFLILIVIIKNIYALPLEQKLGTLNKMEYVILRGIFKRFHTG